VISVWTVSYKKVAAVSRRATAVGIVKRRTMSAMTPDGLSELLECVAAFGKSLDEPFDPARFLAEFSASTQRLVPHDYMLIALREDDGHTYSLFAEYTVGGSVRGDNQRYTTAFERGGRAATESFALAPVFAGEAQLIADVATDDRFREATAFRAKLDEAGLRARLAVTTVRRWPRRWCARRHERHRGRLYRCARVGLSSGCRSHRPVRGDPRCTAPRTPPP